MALAGLDLDRMLRNHVYMADGAQKGDVMAGVWKVGLMNMAPIQCFSEGPENQTLRNIRASYRQCGLNPSGCDRGVTDIQASPPLRWFGCVDTADQWYPKLAFVQAHSPSDPQGV